MAEDAWQPFAKLISKGDLAGVVAALEVLDEPARKKLSTAAKRELKNLSGSIRQGRLNAANAAVFGTGGAVAAARQWWMGGVDEGLRERLVRMRPAAWRQEYAERICADRDAVRWGQWAIVHRMVKDGSIDRPSSPGYVTGAVDHLPQWAPRRDAAQRPLADILRGEPEWLERDLWELFAIEESGLTARDSWGDPPVWRTALRALAAQGVIARERLLDEGLAALRRDFAPYHARWHLKLLAELEPTADELEARLDDLLALLAAEDPAVVAFGLKTLAELERARRLPPERLLDAIGPALVLRAKGHVTRAIKLAGRALRRSPQHARAGLPVLLDALTHESREVQQAVLDVAERHADALSDDDRRRLADLAARLDPALRDRALALAGGAAGQAQPVATMPPEALDVPPRRTHDFAAPRLRPDDALKPIAEADELLDRAAVALERGDDPDEIELVLDAISRLRTQRVDSARATALAERAETHIWAWQGSLLLNHARDAVAVALLRWLRPRQSSRATFAPTGRSPVEAIATRLRELCADLGRRQARALLATPTHRGGWVDAHEAVGRVAALRRDSPLPLDLAQLVLRIAPDGRAAALEHARGLRGEAAGVLAHALGDDARRPWRTKLAAAWEAAELARDPAAYHPPQPEFNDLRPLRARFGRVRIPRVPDTLSPASLAELEEAWWGWEASGLERWLTRAWPARRDGAFLVVCRRLWANTGTREYGIGDVLEILLDPAEPLTGHAALALALGLGAADATDRALAADVTIAALGDRRLDGALLGALLARILREQEIKPPEPWRAIAGPPEPAPTRAVPARWATALADVAGAGPLHARDVQVGIEAILAAARPDDTRRLLVLVDLLRRLAVQSGTPITQSRARAWLEALPPRSKTGRAAREALAVTGGARSARGAAAALRS